MGFTLIVGDAATYYDTDPEGEGIYFQRIDYCARFETCDEAEARGEEMISAQGFDTWCIPETYRGWLRIATGAA
jgi:hypothetical protein